MTCHIAILKCNICRVGAFRFYCHLRVKIVKLIIVWPIYLVSYHASLETKLLYCLHPSEQCCITSTKLKGVLSRSLSSHQLSRERYVL